MPPGIYLPSPILQPYIRQFAIHESADETTYTVLPGTGLVIGFQFSGGLSYLKDQKEIPLSKSGITGLHDGFRVFKNTESTGTVLVVFKEAGAAPFFKQPLHELFRESVSLDNFMLRSELLVLEEQLCEAAGHLSRIKCVEQFLIARMGQTQPDTMVSAALALIHQYKGNIRISNIAKQLNTSQSPLEKRFRKQVGASPKKFASIVRLKHAIEKYDPANTLTGLGYEAGFFDQSHFIKEFRTFTGETPESFFGRRE